MPKFDVDEDLARLVEKLANPKPFENLTFSNALRRVLDRLMKERRAGAADLDKLLDEPMTATLGQHKKAPSPSALLWADSIPELKRKGGLNNWKAICDYLKIETAGDSARRKLKSWVKANRPRWPEVPEIGVE